MKYPLILLLLCLCTGIYAQEDSLKPFPVKEKKFETGVSFGYHYPTAKQSLIQVMQTPLANNPGKYLFGALGQGLEMGITGSYWFTHRMGVHCQIGFFRSDAAGYEYLWARDFISYAGTAASEQWLTMSRIRLGFCVTAHESGKWKLNMNGGLVLAQPLLVEKIEFIEYSGNKAGTQTIVTTGRISTGFYVSLQSSYKLGTQWSLQAEFLAIGQTWQPAKRSITQFELDGTNRLEQMDVWQKEIEFNEDAPLNQSNPNAPYKILPVTYLLNTVGLQVGIVRRF